MNVTEFQTSVLNSQLSVQQRLDSTHSSQAQGLNLRRGWSLGGKRRVDITDEQTVTKQPTNTWRAVVESMSAWPDLAGGRPGAQLLL